MLIVAVLGTACSQDGPRPRSFEVFMEDGLAREGVLARCNQDRDATFDDVECSNARRAAAALAGERDEGRSADLAAASERKLAAMRAASARAEQAAQDAAAAAQAAAAAAYEAQWRAGKVSAEDVANGTGARAPAFGAPLGPVLPSMRDDTVYNVESLSQVPMRPELELAAVMPPQSEIVRPELEIEQAAIIPRPFRNGDEIISR